MAAVLPNPWSCCRLAALLLAALLAGCSITPKPVRYAELVEQAQKDQLAAREGVEPIKEALSLEEAIARALKYNLERRTKMMEEVIALNVLDISTYDMLPKLVASAGYRNRDTFATTRAEDSVTGAASLANPFISSEKKHGTTELGLTWNFLDFGLSYLASKQSADRLLIASERRRKAMHLLIQDVRTAFWRAASAQKLSKDVKAVIELAESALVDARQAEEQRLRSPLDSLRFQRQVLENLRLLELIDNELATAKLELANLINAPLSQEILVQEPSDSLNRRILDLPVSQMEAVAIAQNADLREQFYNSRIAVDEGRKTLLKLFPSLSFSHTVKYDSDKYLINNRWTEAGGQLSLGLLNLFSLPAQNRLADAGIKLSDQHRMATLMAVLAQVHIARLQYGSAYQQFSRADLIWNVDNKIGKHIADRAQAQTQSKLDLVAGNTTAILSLLRRYQSLAQVHAASSKLQATLGMEPQIDSVHDQSLTTLTAQVQQALKHWDEGLLPELPPIPVEGGGVTLNNAGCVTEDAKPLSTPLESALEPVLDAPAAPAETTPTEPNDVPMAIEPAPVEPAPVEPAALVEAIMTEEPAAPNLPPEPAPSEVPLPEPELQAPQPEEQEAEPQLTATPKLVSVIDDQSSCRIEEPSLSSVGEFSLADTVLIEAAE